MPCVRSSRQLEAARAEGAQLRKLAAGRGVRCRIGPRGTQAERLCGIKAASHVRMRKNYFMLPGLQALGIELMIYKTLRVQTETEPIRMKMLILNLRNYVCYIKREREAAMYIITC